MKIDRFLISAFFIFACFSVDIMAGDYDGRITRSRSAASSKLNDNTSQPILRKTCNNKNKVNKQVHFAVDGKTNKRLHDDSENKHPNKKLKALPPIRDIETISSFKDFPINKLKKNPDETIVVIYDLDTILRRDKWAAYGDLGKMVDRYFSFGTTPDDELDNFEWFIEKHKEWLMLKTLDDYVHSQIESFDKLGAIITFITSYTRDDETIEFVSSELDRLGFDFASTSGFVDEKFFVRKLPITKSAKFSHGGLFTGGNRPEGEYFPELISKLTKNATDKKIIVYYFSDELDALNSLDKIDNARLLDTVIHRYHHKFLEKMLPTAFTANANNELKRFYTLWQTQRHLLETDGTWEEIAEFQKRKNKK